MADALDNIDRLQRALEYSYDRLEPFRLRRRTAIEQYVGAHYGDHNVRARVPMNLISLAVTTWVRQLVARNPAVKVKTTLRAAKPIAYTLELVLRKSFARMGLSVSLRDWLRDAMLSPLGILKIGRCMSLRPNRQGHYYGEPYADPVDFDDWVQDMGAQSWEAQQFRGNIYRMTVEDVRSHPLFSRARREAQADEDEARLPGGDDRIITLTSGALSGEDRLYDTCSLLDLYLPYEGKVVTLLGRIGDKLQVLRVDDFPIPHGPYHRIAFDSVPGNPIPRPPVSEIIDLHDLGNALFSKLEDQARRQKTILGVQAAAKDDAERIIEAVDGEVIKMVNPQAVQQYSFGGIDQPSLAFALLIKDLFSYFGGNLDLLAGLGNQSPTLGQDQLLSASASRRIMDMSDTVYSAVTLACKDIAYWLWTDRDRVDYVEKRVPGVADAYATVRLGPQEKAAFDYESFDFEVEPYSMQHQTPQTRIASVMQIMQFLAPYMPLLQQQGKSLNVDALIDQLARDTNIDELRDLFVEADPMMETADEPEALPKPPVSNRTYTRVNRSDRSQRGAQYAIAQSLLGARSQQSEAENAGGV